MARHVGVQFRVYFAHKPSSLVLRLQCSQWQEDYRLPPLQRLGKCPRHPPGESGTWTTPDSLLFGAGKDLAPRSLPGRRRKPGWSNRQPKEVRISSPWAGNCQSAFSP